MTLMTRATLLTKLSKVGAGFLKGLSWDPHCFFICINYIRKSIQTSNICLFEDDTVLLVSSSNRTELELKAFLETNSFIQWFDYNLLSFTLNRTQILPFSIINRYKDNPDTVMLLNDNSFTDYIYFLGISLNKI